MIKPFVSTIATTVTVFAITVIIIQISTFTIPVTVMAAQQQLPINPTSSSQQNSDSSSSATALPLKTIFKQAQASIVQITSKIPTAAPDALKPQSPNATTLGSGFVYDNQWSCCG